MITNAGASARVTGVDACRGGWVAVELDGSQPAAVRVAASLASLLAGCQPGRVVAIDMPLGLAESGWREADLLARGLLGPRRSSVFAIAPRAVWAQPGYAAASRRCRELTGKGLSAQAWGLRAKLLEANAYRETCRHRLCEVHPELAFGAMADGPLRESKHTAAGRGLRRDLLAAAGIAVPAVPAGLLGDVLDAAAAAWSAGRIADGRAVTIPCPPDADIRGREIAIRY
jgi:predicted RNase H-like nuclease